MLLDIRATALIHNPLCVKLNTSSTHFLKENTPRDGQSDPFECAGECHIGFLPVFVMHVGKVTVCINQGQTQTVLRMPYSDWLAYFAHVSRLAQLKFGFN